ncbi:GntR family transcriptional regulator [Nocardia ninae]|uniref:HTH gntR-type domain-containing protein n=1 Tax=Nocardia ninae NBRC 108245 TaxID=1210091 RepID=A0A511MTG7_9NOCA|nr:GntR family transcriptional regulator [Nocardia ninae]GEM43731.1 hypothetical protein NN4_82500 [Nocardia ninae NBRC 108245]
MPNSSSLWREIATDLRRRIEAGEWSPGETLPAMRMLAEHYGTNSHAPINRAVLHLINEGVLVTTPDAPRRGVRVRARPKVVRPIDQRFESTNASPDVTFEQITGMDDVTVEIAYDRETPVDVVELLGDGMILVRTFRYLIAETPHQVMRSWMLDRVAQTAGLRTPDDEVPGRTTETWLREGGIDVRRATLTIESRLPTEEEAAELAMPATVPVMVRKKTLWDAGCQAVETNTTVVVADQIIYRAEFSLEDLC